MSSFLFLFLSLSLFVRGGMESATSVVHCTFFLSFLSSSSFFSRSSLSFSCRSFSSFAFFSASSLWKTKLFQFVADKMPDWCFFSVCTPLFFRVCHFCSLSTCQTPSLTATTCLSVYLSHLFPLLLCLGLLLGFALLLGLYRGL